MFHIFDLFTLCFCCFWFCINIAVKRTSWLYLFFLTTPNPVFIPSVLNITRNRVGPKGCIDPFVVAISKNPFLPLSGKCYLLWLRWSRFFQKAYHLVNMLNLGLITRVSFLSNIVGFFPRENMHYYELLPKRKLVFVYLF